MMEKRDRENPFPEIPALEPIALFSYSRRFLRLYA